VNCDGNLDALDIEPFVIAVTDPVAYAKMYPDCATYVADVNRDGAVDAFDIGGFIEGLFGQ
jgi:hypothetical protein